jgi:hypothetical protein
MYPAIYIGSMLESNGYNVKCHSTTRSPIEVSNDESYPLTHGTKLPSVYDLDRDTFIYNLDKYDSVIIVTEEFASSVEYLVKAVQDYGNDNITVVKVRTF